MTTPGYNELCATVRREGEGIVAAGRIATDVAVKTCGDWTMHDLLVHVGRVYHRAAALVSERCTTAQDAPEAPPADVDAVGYLSEALDELVDALSSADPETPVWNWSDEPDVAAFWARRMAHESTVHRYDAQRAHGLAQPIDADVAHDGMDELVDVLLKRVVSRDSVTLPTATYLFAATDGGTWPLRLSGETIERLDVAKEPDVTARGTTSAVLLGAYGRVKWASLEVEGDAALLDAWSAAVRF